MGCVRFARRGVYFPSVPPSILRRCLCVFSTPPCILWSHSTLAAVYSPAITGDITAASDATLARHRASIIGPHTPSFAIATLAPETALLWFLQFRPAFLVCGASQTPLHCFALIWVDGSPPIVVSGACARSRTPIWTRHLRQRLLLHRTAAPPICLGMPSLELPTHLFQKTRNGSLGHGVAQRARFGSLRLRCPYLLRPFVPTDRVRSERCFCLSGGA